MTRPGTNVVILDSPPPRSAPTTTDVAFFVGFSDQGPLVDLVTSLTDFRNRYGARITYGFLYDAVEVYFREGGTRCYVSRVVGPAAVNASRTLNDGSAVATLKVSAMSPGAWGNSLTVAVATVSGGYTITIANGSTTLEVSPTLAGKNDAIDWAAQSKWVNVSVAGAGGNPATLAASALSSGADDHASATDADWLVAMNRLPKKLGPGQVLAPGNTSTTTRGNLLNHAAANNRIALLDAPDTATVATLISDATAVRAAAPENAKFGRLDASWCRINGLSPTTTRLVPPSPFLAGLIARSDVAGNTPGRAAANRNGQLRTVNGFSQTFSDANMETLYAGQVNLFIDSYTGFVAYGDASLADPRVDPLWVGFASNRVVMTVAARGDAILDAHVFDLVDGEGHLFTKLAGEFQAMLIPLWQEDSLYGATFDDAARVDTGSAVNTTDTIANRELHAAVNIRTSPTTDFVELDLVRTATTESLG